MLLVPVRQNFFVKGKKVNFDLRKKPQTCFHVWKALLQLFEESQICTNTKIISPFPLQQCCMEIQNDKSKTQNTDKKPLEITCTKTFWIGHMKFPSNDFSCLCGFFFLKKKKTCSSDKCFTWITYKKKGEKNPLKQVKLHLNLQKNTCQCHYPFGLVSFLYTATLWWQLISILVFLFRS